MSRGVDSTLGCRHRLCWRSIYAFCLVTVDTALTAYQKKIVTCSPAWLISARLDDGVKHVHLSAEVDQLKTPDVKQ